MKRVLGIAGFLVVLYFAIPACLLHFGIDQLIFTKQSSGATHESSAVNIAVEGGRSVRIRQYGDGQSDRCVVFFPGQHGGIAHYEQTLFPGVRALGATVYAISFPGQDGAEGLSETESLVSDVLSALRHLDTHSACRPHDAVFIGRSLGSTVAILAAPTFAPRGLLLDGVSPTLTDAIRAAMQRRLLTRLLTLLPVRALLRNDFALAPSLREMSGVPLKIFQGTADTITPYANVSAALAGLPNVQIISVRDGRHDDAYLIAKAEYLRQLAALLNSS